MDNISAHRSCKTCGSANRSLAKFCSSCGSALGSREGTQVRSDTAPLEADPNQVAESPPAEQPTAGPTHPSPIGGTDRPNTSVSRTCPNGHAVSSTTRFCGSCGVPITGETPGAVKASGRADPAATARVPPVSSGSTLPGPIRGTADYSGVDAGRNSKNWLIAGVAVVVIIALAGALTYVLTQRTTPHSVATSASRKTTQSAVPKDASASGAKTVPNPGTSAGSNTETTGANNTAQSEAIALNNLLSTSAAARSGVQGAYDDIDSCGSNLQSDYTTLEQAATARQGLLTNFQQLDLSQLPQSQALIEDLVSAWNNSISADQSFAMWAQDEMSGGCTQQDHGDSNWISGNSASVQADTAKSSFTQLWDSGIAPAYNLPQWQSTQI